MLNWVKKGSFDATAIIDTAFNKAVKQTGSVIDSETSHKLKSNAVSAVATAREIDVREEDKAIWIQNPDMLGLTTGPTRPDPHFLKVARMHTPAGCKIVFLGQVQGNSREALYEC